MLTKALEVTRFLLPVGLLGGARAEGVDRDDLGAALLGLFNNPPVMHRLVLMLLHAHSTMYLEWMKLSGSTPPVGSTVSSQAVDEPDAQKVFSHTVAPSL